MKNIGFSFDDNDNIKSLNENKFARFLLTRFNLIYTTGDRFYIYQKGMWKSIEKNQLSRKLRGVLHEFAPDYWTTGLEYSYIEALKRESEYIDKLDANRNYINLSNGMLNIKTYKLEKHDPSFYSSIQIPIEYAKDAKCPKFKKFLKEVFECDEERIKLVQEILGYCLTSETSAQKAFFFYGKGANGKSVLAEILLYLCGKENVSAISLKDLQKPFSQYELVGKLLNLATENEVSEKGLNTTQFKAIVAGDSIQVEKKFEQSFMYKPYCKLVFLLNNLPYSRDRSWGFQRRLQIIPFNRIFREDDPNTVNYDELINSLLQEMSGILNFALRGLKRLRNNNYIFTKSKAVDNVLKEYRETVNPYHAFVDEMIAAGEKNDKINNHDMVRTFKRWCDNYGHKNLSKSTNRKILQEIRDVLKVLNIPYEAGEHCKSGGIRYTGKIRWKNYIIDNDDL